MISRCNAHIRLVTIDLPREAQAARALQIKPDEYRPLQHVYETIAWHYNYCPQCITWKSALISPPTDPASPQNPTIYPARTHQVPHASGGGV